MKLIHPILMGILFCCAITKGVSFQQLVEHIGSTVEQAPSYVKATTISLLTGSLGYCSQHLRENPTVLGCCMVMTPAGYYVISDLVKLHTLDKTPKDHPSRKKQIDFHSGRCVLSLIVNLTALVVVAITIDEKYS
jgi:hypothetical protein